MNDEFYSWWLARIINQAIQSKDNELIDYIRSLWHNESWDSIIQKFQTEGSTWVVWWNDGINALYAKENQ